MYVFLAEFGRVVGDQPWPADQEWAQTQVHSLIPHSHNPTGWLSDTAGKSLAAGPTVLRAQRFDNHASGLGVYSVRENEKTGHLMLVTTQVCN